MTHQPRQDPIPPNWEPAKIRLALPPPPSILRCKSAELEQAGLVRMQLQVEPAESFRKRC